MSEINNAIQKQYNMNALRVSGYDPKFMTKELLYELFCQGGPIISITFSKKPDVHAVVRFHHDESVPYCLALFEGIELHKRLLRLNPIRHNKNTYIYLNHLKHVREILRDEYAKMSPPNLPPKKYNSSITTKSSRGREKTKRDRKCKSKRGSALAFKKARRQS